MTMSERQVGSITVLDLSGRLTASDTTMLKDRVSSLVNAGRVNIVLNLAELTHVDSSGLGQIVSCHLTAKEKGAVKLANLGKRIHDLLVITRLNVIFEVYDSESEAIASFVPTA